MAAAEMHLAATDRAKEKAGQGWSLLSDELRQALVAKEALPIIAQNENVPGYDRVSHLADFVLAG